MAPNEERRSASQQIKEGIIQSIVDSLDPLSDTINDYAESKLEINNRIDEVRELKTNLKNVPEYENLGLTRQQAIYVATSKDPKAELHRIIGEQMIAEEAPAPATVTATA